MIIKAYAKINLTLDIIGRRQDGYHILDSVFQSVGLFDTLEIKKDDEISVKCDGVKQQNNTAFIAANEFFNETGIVSGVSIKIHKNIPFLSGLGGGSADAAAVITALDKIYETNLNADRLNKLALRCGADVPFCLTGGTSRIGGIGEEVKRLTGIEGFWVVIVKEGEKKSTADMYRRLDDIGASSAFTAEFIRCIGSCDYAGAFSSMGNAFAQVAADENLISVLRKQNPLGASLSGSGPSHFAVFPDKTSALFAADNLKKSGFMPFAVPFVNSGYNME